ncbi:MAG: TolC family protein [Verrucomicrobia bacterium]|jgi:outer membrane protein TolC|nr:TolC family protein [Verrucomicrobiota bacterium]MBT5062546.1 TolC family protein [Verrucomicrobiota bacterium]MBT5480319.1 TolC family protein [Verrucomicrobiota bacterium]MBT6238752.1 TolC family protein [Verrucomicrobiota bacterium]MBT6805474.1 TolC family protein [Verrucomicrobiota bacterium]
MVLSFRNKPNRWIFLAATVCCSVLVACKSSYYKKKTDKDVYSIIEQIETDLFGQSSEFSVDTRYSGRLPEDISSQEIIDDRNFKEEKYIDINTSIDLAIQSSREYQNQKESLYLTALSLSETEFVFSPNFLARSTASGDRGSNGERSGGVNSRLSVNQALRTGGNIGASFANDLLKFYTGNPRRSAVSTISVNLFQPLLRGAGRRVAAENLKQAERNVAYAIRDFSHFQNEFAVGTVLDYFRLLQNKDIIRNRYLDYQSRTNQTVRLNRRLDAGLETSVYIGQAQQSELSTRNAYINVIANYQTTLDRFKINLGLPLGVDLNLDDSSLESLSREGLPLLDIDPEYAFELALEYSWPLMNDIDRFEDSKRKVYVAANRLKTGIDFFADASLSSDRPTDYTSFDPDDIRAGMGVELDLPINRFRERNQYRSTIISFEAALRRLSLALDNKRNQIRLGLRNLKQFEQNYQIQKLAVQLADERVTGADLNYQAGRATLRDIQDAQDDLVAARNSLITLVVDYLEARMSLLLDIGVLRTKGNAFWIDEAAIIVDLNTRQLKSEESPIDAEEDSNNSALPTPEELFNK